METCSLAGRKCVPCRGGVPPLAGEALQAFLRQLAEGWQVAGDCRLEKEYRFKNFAEALDFTNRVGCIAEAEGHHPDIQLGWGRVKLSIWTHKIGGLTESDFILAAKADAAR